MNIALTYCAKDREQAERLAGWLVEIGPFPRHSFLIFRHADCPPIAAFEQFASGETVIHDDVFNSWPQSANHVFKKVGKEIEYGNAKPFLWLEPDAVPLHGKAFDQIEEEYNRLGRPFLGDIINEGRGFVPHMSGIGVYPGRISNFAGEIYFAGSTPWDVHAAGAILPQAAQSELIFHKWKAEPIESLSEFNQHVLSVRPKCVLFHSDKSGKLIELLRSGKPAPPAAADLLMDVSGKVQPEAPTLATCEEVEAKVFGAGFALPVKPWANFDESMAEIHLLCKRLAQFCDPAKPSRVRAVRIALHEAWIIKLPYRPKKKLKKPHWNKGGRGRGKKPPGWKPRDQIRAEKKAAKEAAAAKEENAGNQ